jgi:erythromycin esterase-like protein
MLAGPTVTFGDSITEEQWINWIRENAVQFDTLNWLKIDMEDLSFLDEALKGKRVVYLGEPDHYIHEKYDFRLILIRYLFEKGWRYIGMEMGLFDGFKVDEYLKNGDGSILNQMQVYGYRGDLRSDRDDEYKGFAANKHPTFRSTFVAEEKRFLKQLRSLNEDQSPGEKRLHWFGFDVDKRPGLGYERIEDLLGAQKSTPEIEAVMTRLKLVEGESRKEELARIEEAIKDMDTSRDKLLSQLGDADYLRTHKYLRGIKNSLIFLDRAIDGPQSRGWVPALIEREKVMFHLMDELLAELPPDEKIILMAHNMHLCKDYTTCGFVGFPMWPSIGTHVAKALPDQVYSIWMLYDHGRHANVSRTHVFEDVPSHPGRIEHLMAKAGSQYLLPLFTGDPREAYLDGQRNFVLNGGIGEGLIRKQADAIFFVKQVQAIRSGDIEN